MASTFNRFGAVVVRHSFRTRPQAAYRSTSRSAFFHGGSVCRADEPPKQDNAPEATAEAKAPQSDTATTRPNIEDEIIDYGEVASAPADQDPFWGFPNSLSQGEREKVKKELRDYIKNPPEDQKADVMQWRREVSALQSELLREFRKTDETEFRPKRINPKIGLIGEGETHPELYIEDPPEEGDDITSMAHADLEQHREIREYTRLAAWEMPLLSQYAKEYKPPSKSTPLRFRHTSYMGETHPAQHKIVLEFCTADLPLTPAQRLKLIKLVGPRYDPRKDHVKMSCEMYESPAQNKRYLSDLVDTLMMEAKNESTAEGGKDKFDDIGPDFRHVKFRKRLVFPSAWKMTSKRQAALEAERTKRSLAEQDRVESGRLVAGVELIEASVKRAPRIAQASVEQVRAGRTQPQRLTR